MFKIDLKNRKPIYEQVVDNFKRMIISGELSENTRVPSIRDMAKTLGINPNTVQKAYRELESGGFFYTVLGQGNFTAKPPENNLEITALYENLTKQIHELVFRGVSIQEIIEFVGKMKKESNRIPHLEGECNNGTN